MAQLTKNIRLIVLLVILLASLYFLVNPLVFRASGVIVTAVSEEAKCGQIKEDDVITQLKSIFTKDVVEFRRAVSSIKEKEHVSMIINNGPGWCEGVKDGDIGIDVVDIPSDQLKFGIDIQGGTITSYRLTSKTGKMEEVSETIEKRIVLIGLPEAKVEVSDSEIKIFSLTTEKLNFITAPGEVETKMFQEINLENKSGNIVVGNNTYTVDATVTSLTVNGTSYTVNERFTLDGIDFDVMNIKNDSFSVEASIFTNKDVLTVLGEPFSSVGYNPVGRRYEYRVQLELSPEALNRANKIVDGINPTFEGRLVQLVYYLDGKLVSSIPVQIPREEIINLPVLGFGNTLADVSNQKLKIQTILNSNTLPDLEVVGIEYYEPSLNMTVIGIISLGAIVAGLSILNVTHFRYKKIKFGGYSLLLIGAEIFCVVGIASLTQSYYSPGWILDFPSMLGLFTFLSISSTQKILSAEQQLKNNEIPLRYKYKKIMNLSTFLNVLFFVVSFSLLFTGWKGYGLSVFIGMVISMLITTPMCQNALK